MLKISCGIRFFAATGLLICAIGFVLDYRLAHEPNAVQVTEVVLIFDQNGSEISHHALASPIGSYDRKIGYRAFFDVDDNGEIYTNLSHRLRNRYGPSLTTGRDRWEKEFLTYTSIFQPFSNDVYLAKEVGHWTNAVFRIIKIDARGEPLWMQELQPSLHQNRLRDAAVDSSGNVLLAGSAGERWIASGPGGRQDHPQNFFMVKLSSSGETLWQHTIEQNRADHCANSICVDPSGDFFVAGTMDALCWQNTPNWCDYYLARFNQYGRALWSKHWGSPLQDTAILVKQDRQGFLYVLGRSGIGSRQLFQVMKVSEIGNILWTCDLGEFAWQFEWKHRWHMFLTPKGEVLLLNQDEAGVFLTRVNQNGIKIWQKTLGPRLSTAYGAQWQEIGGIGMDTNANSYILLATLRMIKTSSPPLHDPPSL